MFKAVKTIPVLSKTFTKRLVSSSSVLRSSSVFNMPAMSPTMTEGGITSWKLKPGEEFKAGDVLLEIETDKATIDVEAQDDGILWEILVAEGESGIAVGKPIAFLAEVGDDLNTLEKPVIEETPKEAPKESPKESPKTEESKSEAPKQNESAPAQESSESGSIFVKANPSQKLMPSVEVLLHQNNISKEEALSKIEASGPKGRLLKGDVLNYLGQIKKDSILSITKIINSKQHLDLSNIVLKAPEPQTKESDKAPAAKAPRDDILTIQLTSEFTSKAEFKQDFENLIHSSLVKTYGSKFPQYAHSPSANTNIQTDIFDELLVPSPSTERFKIFDVTYKFNDVKPNFSPVSDFDDLLSPVAVPTPSGKVDVEFKIQINPLIDSKDFFSSFKSILLSQF
ncbi:pyruvate dehydrogenase complex protein X component, mitochondrial [[Candida] jaroonii]|uniref:Pyruvate dehydrogenase complex protein X component, mitochondrial n=1 Tax=[Candida] jaroonii TaxID=467808 RepID=A0ACA9Y7S3_9ASCO|nr:pyruvate dehydrogenase complex protein X component, mitochondrial [[Candida] jaroonii]